VSSPPNAGVPSARRRSEPERAFETHGEVETRRQSLLGAALGFMGLGIVLVFLRVPLWGPVIEEGLAITLLVAWASNTYPVRRRGLVRADRTGVSLDGGLLVARSSIESAYRLSTVEPIVRIATRGYASLDVRLPEDHQATELLDALSLEVGRSVATFRAVAGGRPLLPHMLVVGASVVVLFGEIGSLLLLHHLGFLRLGGPIVALLPIALYVPLLLAVFARMAVSVDVGSDGILLRRLFHRRFISHRELEGVTAEGAALVLKLRSGAVVRLSVGASGAQLEARDALAARIEEARLASAEGTTAEGSESLVAPGGRPIERWLHDLRALAHARDYRETRLDEDRLWRVVGDPAAPAATRAGAALALSSLDEGSRSRLRVTAEACAEPHLRIALTRVAEGASDADLEEILAPLVEGRA
jgi:hypothetical protein